MRYILALALCGLIVISLWRTPISEPAVASDYSSSTIELTQEQVVDFCKKHPDTYVAILSPRAAYAYAEVSELLNRCGHVVFSKQIPQDKDDARLLLLKMYGELCDAPHKWIRNERAVQGHLRSRFCEGEPTWLIVFVSANKDNTVAWKRYIRQFTGIGTTGLHVTDTQHEAVLLAEYLLTSSPEIPAIS